jgi:hypothetical protein
MKYLVGLLLNLEGPAFNRHVPAGQEVFKIFPIDAVMAAGKAERFEPIALDPFQDGALAYLAVGCDVFGG